MGNEVNMKDLCSKALEAVADSSSPLILIKDAIEEANKEAERRKVDPAASFFQWGDPLSMPGINDDVVGPAPYKGWRIVQSRVNKNYVLVDPEGKVRGQKWEPKGRNPNFQLFLEVLISLAHGPDYLPEPSSMIIYQLVANKELKIKKGCKGLTVSEARNRFPHSKDLASGFFTHHPVDEEALVPVENYFANIALNQDQECVVLLGKMGAKSVRIKKVDKSKERGEGELTAKTVFFDASVGGSIGNELLNYSELTVKFEGHRAGFSPDILRNSVWFRDNGQMNAILEGRLPKEGKLLKWDITQQIDKTFNFDFKAAANVLGILEGSLRAQYEKATKQLREFHVEFGE